MSERERKLLMFFGTAGVILLCLWGYTTFINKRNSVRAERATAETTLKEAELFEKSQEALADEIDWLAEHEPAPEAGEQVPGKLQQLCAAEATRAGMTVKQQKILPDKLSGDDNVPRRYMSAKVEFNVTGKEQQMYAWFDRMHSPNDFRVISTLRLTPNRDDDTQIDCVVTVEQWYLPLSNELQ
jgi:hypothetical protein